MPALMGYHTVQTKMLKLPCRKTSCKEIPGVNSNHTIIRECYFSVFGIVVEGFNTA